jgi:DNA-binding SARP family transcriptional activator/tetratricopeptide (TPR) repeat protein
MALKIGWGFSHGHAAMVDELAVGYLAQTLQSQRASIWLCGPLRVEFGARRVEALLPARQGRLVFAYLVLRRERPVARDELVEALWPGRSPEHPNAALDTLISRLRGALGADRISGRRELSLVLGPDPWIDVEVAPAAVAAGRTALEDERADEAFSCAEQALGIIKQPLLRDLDRPWLDDHRRQLEALRPPLLAVMGRAGLLLGGSALAHGVEAARELVALEPFGESARELLMRLLAATGDVAEAVRVYDDLRVQLRDELGIVPSPQLTALHERLLTAPEQLLAIQGSTASRSCLPVGPVVLALPRALETPTGSPFVGRDAELALLRERWTQVQVGARSAVVIGGEAGIGKTSLASEFAKDVHARGALVLYGRCDEDLAVPYQPFVEALRPYTRTVDRDRLRAQLGDLAPELGRLLPELSGSGEPVRGDPESERFALFEAVAALVEAMTCEQKLLLVLDDLHWAAIPTLLLLRHLIRSQRPLGALVLCTYRHTELDRDHPLARLLADLHRDADTEYLSIGGLDEPAIATLLRAAVGPPLDESTELVRLLGTQTAGNPFFLRALLVHVAGSGERARRSVKAEQFEAPAGLRQVIGYRVARLSDSARRALRVAAVAGSTFSFLLIERVLSAEPDVLDALDEAVAAGLLSEAEHGDYVFTHALVRQTIYAQLGAARQMRLHRRLGEALEALGHMQTRVGELAYHFARAATDGQAAKAADYALAAGRNATARLSYEDAVAHYERGLEALALSGQTDDKRRCELLLALGDARWDAGELDTARQAYGQAADVADRLGDNTALAHAALGFCGPHRIELDAAVVRAIADVLQRSLTALGDDDSALRAQLMGRLAYAYFDQHKPLLAIHALEMARRVGDKGALADVLASSHWALHSPDMVHESLARAAELRCVAGEVGNLRLIALAHRRLRSLLLELGDIQDADRELQALQRLAATRGQRHLARVVTALVASQALLHGRLEECEALAHEALALRFEGHDDQALHTFGVQLFFVCKEQGRFDEIVKTVEGYVARYPKIASWRCALASAYAQLARKREARHEFELYASANFSALPRDGLWLSSMSALSEVAAFLDDAPRALTLYEQLLPYADRCAVSFALVCHGSVSRQLGLLATTLSRYEDAARHFEHALKMNAQIKSPLWIAHTQRDYAYMLLVRNRDEGRDKALQLLNAALLTAEQLGLKAVANTTRPLLAAQTDKPPTVSQGGRSDTIARAATSRPRGPRSPKQGPPVASRVGSVRRPI